MGELALILLIILLLFGGAKIPEIARNLGKGLSEFRKGLSGGSSGDEDSKKKKH
jgi:sec-independent protein translocase protein TatA